MRALVGASSSGSSEDTTTTTPGPEKRALDLLQQSLEEDARVSVEALAAVVGVCERGGDWESAMDVFFRVLDNPPDTWLVAGEGVYLSTLCRDEAPSLVRSCCSMCCALTLFLVPVSLERLLSDTAVDRMDPGLSSNDLIPELGMVLDRIMQACNASKQFGLSLVCLLMLIPQIA